MKLIFLPGWYKRWPRLVRSRVRATIYRAPVDRVIGKEQTYFDSRSVYAVGVVKETLFVVFGAEGIFYARRVVIDRAHLQAERHEVLREPMRLRRGVVAGVYDVVEYREELA